jgi:hypothetical protein
MHASSVSASGVAFLAAAVIGVAPITSTPPAIATATATVRLAAVPSPLEFYPEVAQRAVYFAASLAHQYFSDPVPITRAVINNQAAAVSNIIAAVESGDPAAVRTALTEAVTQPIENAITAGGVVVDQSRYLALSAISPVLQVFWSTDFAIRAVVASVTALNLIDLLNSVLNIPAHLFNGIINGGYFPYGNPFDPVRAGLLTPVGSLLTIGGPFSTQVLVDQQVAQAISPESAVTSTPLRRPAATGRPITAAPVTESGPPELAPETTEPDLFSRVQAAAAVEADAAVESVSAVKSDAAVEAPAAPERPAQRPSRHGHRGDSAAESTPRTER